MISSRDLDSRARDEGSVERPQNDRGPALKSHLKQITIKKKSNKSLQANLWLSEDFPLSIDQFMPLIHVLSFCSKQIRQFNKFL